MKKSPWGRLLWAGYLLISAASFVIGIFVLEFNGFNEFGGAARDMRYDIISILMLSVPWLCIYLGTKKSKAWLLLGVLPLVALFALAYLTT
jgi:hypothetical protein